MEKILKILKFFLCFAFTFTKNDVEKSFRNSFKKRIERIDSTIRIYKDFFRKNKKFRKFDSKKVKKKFLYKFFNVKNDDNDVQNAIDRNKHRNKNKNREDRENRRRENEISREKTKEFKNSNFNNFSKISYFKCCQKEHYARDCIVFALVNKLKKKLINVVSIALIQIVKDRNILHYFVILITLYINIIIITIITIIDNEIIHNFIFQLKIKCIILSKSIFNFRIFDVLMILL